ncbi:InlB B-repeat-containing protein, partial [Candidatus Saccharibacteria bacterium]|nr:InlB B-repeat-containing protein [Candidatus Saccharibacteria bacterium]
MNRLKTNIGLFVSLGLFSLTVISFVLLVSSTSSALTVSGSSPVTASATAAVNVSEACTFEGYLDSPHTATLNPGTFQASIGSTIFTTVCNDTNGYSIYAVGYTAETVGNTVLAANINGTANPTYDIATGTATSGGTSNWAMMLAPVSGNNPTITNSFNAYHSVPTTYTQVATYGSATTSGGTGSQVTATYQVFATSAQPAGLYAGKVKYIMVHPANETPAVEVACANNKICYNANTNIKEGTMGQQSGSANAGVVLMASNFSRDGYGFAGWNTKPDYSGTFYGPNETITTPADMSAGLPLYAVWVASSGSLQGWG